MRRLHVLLAIAAVVVLLSSIVASSCSSGAQGTVQGNPQVGKPAPDIVVASLADNASVSLESYRGKPVLLNFWASWCSPCRAEMPLLQEISTYSKWTDKGLVFLAVNLGEDAATARAFMEENSYTFTVVLDKNGYAASAYNVRSIPASFFIDANGVIQDIRPGPFISRDDVEKRLAKIAP